MKSTVHIPRVLKVLSALLFPISGIMLTPLLVNAVEGRGQGIDAFFIPAAVGFALALILWFSTRKTSGDLSTREGFLLVSMAWVTVSLLGALPFVISGAIPSYTDAFFETMSGFTTTGASILSEIESLPREILFWRSLTHWLGGMGIVVLAVALFPLLGIGGLQLMKAEAPGPDVDRLTNRITATAKILWGIYLGMTVLQTILLLFGGMDLFEALTHTFGTLATGGFSPRNASVGAYSSPWIQNVITFFMVMAGMNFILHYRLLTGRIRTLARNTELKVYLSVFIVSSAIMAISLVGSGRELSESVRSAAFQSASILTTTGYATEDFSLWPELAQSVLFFLMFVGGSTGSTGGGMKVMRLWAMIKLGFTEMKYLVQPRGVFALRLNGYPIKRSLIYTVAGFVALYTTILLITTMVVAFHGYDLLSSFTTALATLGNIGPGFGTIGPVENYGHFAPGLKWFLSFIMMVGRLEVYTVLVLFTPRFWRA